MPVAGTYTVTIQTPMGAQQGTLTVEPHGDRFTGSVSNPMMGKMEITDGTVSGDGRIDWNELHPDVITLDGLSHATRLYTSLCP